MFWVSHDYNSGTHQIKYFAFLLYVFCKFQLYSLHTSDLLCIIFIFVVFAVVKTLESLWEWKKMILIIRYIIYIV